MSHYLNQWWHGVAQKDAITTMLWFLDKNMSATPDIFQCMLLGHKGPISGFSVAVSGHHIEMLECMKILGILVSLNLGITFDKELKFGTHICNLSNAVSRQIIALQRLSKFLNDSWRLQIYQSFVSMKFNFSPVLWMCCGKLDGKKLEKLQEIALRFVYKIWCPLMMNFLKRVTFYQWPCNTFIFLASRYTEVLMI